MAPHSWGRQAGLTMVELMVAMTLGLLLTAAVLQTFVSAKRTYEFQQELSRIQENGRFAMQFLTRDLRDADFWGCIGAGSMSAVGSVAGSSLNGLDGTNGGSPYSVAAGPAPDSLRLRGGVGGGSAVLNTNDPQITLNGAVTIVSGATMAISDCVSGVLFEVAAVTAVSGNTVVTAGANLDQTFGDDALLYGFRERLYRIESGAGSSGEPVLTRDGAELVEGVENLQVLYGEDTNGDRVPDFYVAPDQVTNMDNVRGVQLSLVARSLRDNVTDGAQAYTYNGATITPTDRRLRKVFTTTVTLRNRMN